MSLQLTFIDVVIKKKKKENKRRTGKEKMYKGNYH